MVDSTKSNKPKAAPWFQLSEWMNLSYICSVNHSEFLPPTSLGVM